MPFGGPEGASGLIRTATSDGISYLRYWPRAQPLSLQAINSLSGEILVPGLILEPVRKEPWSPFFAELDECNKISEFTIVLGDDRFFIANTRLGITVWWFDEDVRMLNEKYEFHERRQEQLRARVAELRAKEEALKESGEMAPL